jgi:hypothetical protein
MKILGKNGQIICYQMIFNITALVVIIILGIIVAGKTMFLELT